ncbi:MAG: cytochrome b N-terminal domain-containing protein [Nitrospirota bacterium]
MLASLLKRIDPWLKLSQFTYKIPTHGNSFFYATGGVAFVGFILMILTGLLLTQVYDPAPTAAYESLKKIEQIGWTSFVRAIHYWIAQGVIVLLLLHIARVFITGAYQHPRQVTWWIGILLFATMLMGSYFSGTILKWDEEGADALAHYRVALQYLGPIGAFMTESLPGSNNLNLRLFASHIAVFPILILFLAIIHLYLIHTFNLSPTPKDQWADQPHVPEEEMKARFNDHAVCIFIYSALYYGALIVMAFFSRATLMGVPSPNHAALKPPWPFLWMYGFENIWGVVAVLFCSLALFGFLALVPLLDRKQDRRVAARKPILILGGLVAFTLIALSIHGWITPAQMHDGHSHGEESGLGHSEAHPHEDAGEEHPHSDTPKEDHSHPEEKASPDHESQESEHAHPDGTKDHHD